jgi:hypothetical protein
MPQAIILKHLKEDILININFRLSSRLALAHRPVSMKQKMLQEILKLQLRFFMMGSPQLELPEIG